LGQPAAAAAPAGATVPAGAAVPAAAPSTAEPGLDRDLKERERELILATLRITGGSRKLAAERLGISPRTLRHKLQQLKAAGIIVPRLHEHSFATA
jgi:two-component system response regulator FlrC